MAKRNLDTAGIGIKAVNIATDVILQADHLFQKIDGDAEKMVGNNLSMAAEPSGVYKKSK